MRLLVQIGTVFLRALIHACDNEKTLGEKRERVDDSGARLRGKRSDYGSVGTYFLVLRHFVTGMDAGGPGNTTSLKVETKFPRGGRKLTPERTG